MNENRPPDEPTDDDADSPPAPGASFLEQLWAQYAETHGFGDTGLRDALPSPAASELGDQDTLRTDAAEPTSAGTSPTAGRYRIDGEVARGGMGAILRVWDETLRRELAMKVIVEGRETDAGLIGRFVEEAQITGQLEHPGIVPVHEIGFDPDGQLYFTMRLIRGHDLRTVFQWVRDGREEWTTTRALNLLLRVCEAVAYAHSRGVIHRDLKPANVMVGSFGEVYVMDWGLAKIRGTSRTSPPSVPNDDPTASAETTIVTDRREEASRVEDSPYVTAAGAIVGTPAYMAPEQARGELDAVDARTDVYAVGALLYSLLTGRLPFVESGEKPSADTVVERVRSSAPTPVEEIDPSVSPELVAIQQRAMARAADDRYADMQAMASDLRAYLEQRVVRAYRTGAWAEFRKWVQRNRSLATSLATLVLVVTIGSLAFSWYSNRQYREILELGDLYRLEVLVRDAEELYPARQEQVVPMEAWLVRAEELAARRARHATPLAELRELADPYRDEDRALDRQLHPDYLELLEFRRAIPRLERKLAMARADDNTELIDGLANALARAQAGLAELEAKVDQSPREHYRFANDPVRQWRHDQLRDLVHGIDRLVSDDVSERLAADVRERLDFAQTVQSLTLDSTEARAAWAEAIAAIAASDRYDGLELTPQLGLLPLGENSRTGLWEFWHPLTGDRPRAAPPLDGQGSNGDWIITETTGLVFILIPGATFDLGDPELADSQPVHPVTLAPYFISKYELTQGQWTKVVRRNPSKNSVDISNKGQHFSIDARHPVEHMTWIECDRWLKRMALQLPTEAQWENAARGETKTSWWFSSEPGDIRGRANLRDLSYYRYLDKEPEVDFPDYDDGYAAHSPVDAFPPNPFGLHGVLGNVREWCQDLSDSYEQLTQVGTGERDSPQPGYDAPRVIRGGHYRDGVEGMRSGARYSNEPDEDDRYVGVRPARAIDP